MISRRDFLKTLSRLAVTAGGTWMILSDPSWQRLLQGGHAGLAFGDTYLDELIKSAPKARYWKSLEIRKGGTPKDQTLIQCLLCANNCVIADGQCGRCRTRMNVKGELRSLVYGRPISVHIDPIEKKPFYHFLPGSAFAAEPQAVRYPRRSFDRMSLEAAASADATDGNDAMQLWPREPILPQVRWSVIALNRSQASSTR